MGRATLKAVNAWDISTMSSSWSPPDPARASSAVTTQPTVQLTKVRLRLCLYGFGIMKLIRGLCADTQGCPNVIKGNYFDCD